MAPARFCLVPSEESVVADLLLLRSCVSEEGALKNRGSAVSFPPQFIFFSFLLLFFNQKHPALAWHHYRINLLLFAQPWSSQEKSVKALLLMRSLTVFTWLSQDGHTCAPG